MDPPPVPSPAPAQPLRYLLLDLNSYFASVEQQLNPDLRGKPIAVAPVMADGGCCVAVSYEAKRFGVKTGTRVGEARRLCPDIIFVKTQHRAYIEHHHRIIEAVDSCIPVEQVMSIDEFSCRLARDERTPASVAALAARVKHAIASRVGEFLKCSIGIAPNRLLAKLASDMQKPDGLVVLEHADLPHRLLDLPINALPGIGIKMNLRLNQAGIRSMADLYQATETQLERAWGGVLGRFWYRWLRGEQTDDRPTHRRSVGHQHVLPPDCRSWDAAWSIAVRLLHKAAARMRSVDCFAQRLTLTIGLAGQRVGVWGSAEAHDPRNRPFNKAVRLQGGRQDTMSLVDSLKDLWSARPRGSPSFIGVTLSELLPARSVTAPLFAPERNREELSRLMDQLDASHGAMTVYLGAMHQAKDKASGGIAFRSVPDLNLPDSVR